MTLRCAIPSATPEKKKQDHSCVLGVSGQLQSTVIAIHLAVLCKAEDSKQFGYSRVLEPLLKDLTSLERDGVFVLMFGKIIEGTVWSLIIWGPMLWHGPPP